MATAARPAAGVGTLAPAADEVLSPIVDLTAPLTADSTVTGTMELTIRPLQKSATMRDLEFDIQALPYGYPWLRGARFHVTACVYGEGGETDILTTKDSVAPISLLGPSFFSTAELRIGGVNIPQLCNTNIPYKSFVEYYLSYSEAAAETSLESLFFYPDDELDSPSFTAAGSPVLATTNTEGMSRQPAATADDEINAAWARRAAACAYSEKFTFSTPVPIDFFHGSRLFPSGHRINLRMRRTPDEFLLLRRHGMTESYQLHLEDIVLTVPIKHLRPDIDRRLLNATERFYPYRRTELRSFAGTGTVNPLIQTAVWNDALPRSVVIFLVDSNKALGTYDSSPWECSRHNVEYCNLYVDGHALETPYRQNFNLAGQESCRRSYRQLLDNTGWADLPNEATLMSYNRFVLHHNMFAFDLTLDKSNGYHMAPSRSGTIDVSIRFSTPPGRGVTVMCFGVFDACISFYPTGVLYVHSTLPEAGTKPGGGATA